MTGITLKGEQLRALLVLLLLLPLLPAAVMFRFLMVSVESERLAARERDAAVYAQALQSIRRNLATRVAPLTGDARMMAASEYLESIFSDDVRIVVGETAAGPDSKALAVLVEAGLRVELFSDHDEPAAAQTREYATVGGGALLLTLVIGAVAAAAVNRRLRLNELESDALATVSHELRTPLASSQVLLDTLREGRLSDEATRREYLDLLAGENRRLVHLTESFLDATHAERKPPAFESVRIGEVINAAVSRVEPLCHTAACHIRKPVTEEDPRVRADRDALATALGNILDNAIRYTGGAAPVEVNTGVENGRVIIEVADRGPGIPVAERKRIFKRFYQVDRRLSRAHGGCGLGLYIVDQIVKQHGGRVSVRDREGGGSVFVLSLPLMERR